jgi:putative inorganic carbon (HCO3(-)) transporter
LAIPVTQASEGMLLRYSRWGLVVTAGALPLYVVRWRYGPLPTTLLETLIVLTIVMYVIARWRDGWRRPVPTPYDVPVLLLLLAATIAVFVAQDRRGGLGLYRAYFIEPILIFYVAADLLRRTETLGRVLASLAIGSSGFAVLNILAFARALAAHQVHVGAAPTAVYTDSNYVAMYLEPPVALAAGLVLFATVPRWRKLGIAWLAITGLALLLSFSKGAWLALCVVGFVSVLTVAGLRVRIALLAAIVAVALVISRVPLIAERLSTTPDAINGRMQIFTAAILTLREHPLFGLGIGGYSFKFNHVSPEPYPHDIWLTFWVEIGVLGVIAFALILFGLLVRGWRAWPRVQGFERAALWGVLGALVLWTVHGLVDSPYWKNDMSVEFWILAAIEVAVISGLNQARIPKSVRSPAPAEIEPV